jgi:hypothetical protein
MTRIHTRDLGVHVPRNQGTGKALKKCEDDA